MLGHPRNPTRFGAGQAHMKISILSEKLLNRTFISPAWAAASIHLNPFLRILRSFDSGFSCASWQPRGAQSGCRRYTQALVSRGSPVSTRRQADAVSPTRFIRAPNSANASSTGATDHERFLDSSDACQYTLLDRLRDMKLTGYGAAFAHEKVAGRPRGG